MKRYNLKFWRMKQGLTQAELAARLGISTGHYKGIENGVYDPSNKILDKFNREFSGLDLNLLFAEEYGNE